MLKPVESVDSVDSELSEYSAYIPEIAQLSAIKQRTLVAVVGNVLSEDSLTDAQLAELVGVDRNTIRNHRLDPLWGKVLQVILSDIVKGTSDKAMKCLFSRAQHDTAAIKVWLNMADMWIDKRQQLNLNAKLDPRTQGLSFTDTIDDTLTLIGSAGWTEERLVERWRLLKREGAF